MRMRLHAGFSGWVRIELASFRTIATPLAPIPSNTRVVRRVFGIAVAQISDSPAWSAKSVPCHLTGMPMPHADIWTVRRHQHAAIPRELIESELFGHDAR
jgi:hypothetical protein